MSLTLTLSLASIPVSVCCYIVHDDKQQVNNIFIVF